MPSEPKPSAPKPKPKQTRFRGPSKAVKRVPDLNDEIGQLVRLEAENRSNNRQVKLNVNVPLRRKRAYLELAERHGEDYGVVVRACLEYGYAHFANFAKVDPSASSPFLPGMLTSGRGSHPLGQPPPHIADPTGRAWPPPPIPPSFVPPASLGWTPNMVPQGTSLTYTEPVFSAPDLSRFLPNGATPPPAEVSSAPPPPMPPDSDPAPEWRDAEAVNEELAKREPLPEAPVGFALFGDPQDHGSAQ